MKMFPKVITGVIGMAAAFALGTAATHANLLVNGDMESAGGFTANPITIAGVNMGWAQPFGPNSSGQSSAYAESGTYSLQVTEGAAVWNPAGTYQIVSGVTAGLSYTLGVDILAPAAMTDPNWSTPIDIQLQFLDGSLNNLSTIDLGWSAIGTVGQWTHYSVSGIAPGGTVFASPYLMMMESGGQQAAGDFLYMDNATLDVPEPGTIALLGLGLSLPIFAIRRRK